MRRAVLYGPGLTVSLPRHGCNRRADARCPSTEASKNPQSISERMPDGLRQLNVIADDVDYHHHG